MFFLIFSWKQYPLTPPPGALAAALIWQWRWFGSRLTHPSQEQLNVGSGLPKEVGSSLRLRPFSATPPCTNQSRDAFPLPHCKHSAVETASLWSHCCPFLMSWQQNQSSESFKKITKANSITKAFKIWNPRKLISASFSDGFLRFHMHRLGFQTRLAVCHKAVRSSQLLGTRASAEPCRGREGRDSPLR